MSFISVFDVLGPNMIGPSSSHTAGAVLIANVAHKLLAPPLKKVDFTLYGSFAKTYHGHGTDRALMGGIMGFSTDDLCIRDSFRIANERGLAFSFTPNEVETDIHPNTVGINGVRVDFSGEYASVVVIQQDKPGVVAHLTKVLSDRNVNIAFMRLFREGKGDTAYSIIESDGTLPEGIDEELRANPYIQDVMIVQS